MLSRFFARIGRKCTAGSAIASAEERISPGYTRKNLGYVWVSAERFLMKSEDRKQLEEAVIATPIEYLLLETDSPYVKPEIPDAVTGKKWMKARNMRLILPAIAEKIAEMKERRIKFNPAIYP